MAEKAITVPEVDTPVPAPERAESEAATSPEVAAVKSGMARNVSGQRVDVSESMVVAVAGEEVNITDSMVCSAAAGEITATDSFILFGAVGELKGDAKVLLDARAAAVGGAVFAVLLALLGKLLGGRRQGA